MIPENFESCPLTTATILEFSVMASPSPVFASCSTITTAKTQETLSKIRPVNLSKSVFLSGYKWLPTIERKKSGNSRIDTSAVLTARILARKLLEGAKERGALIGFSPNTDTYLVLEHGKAIPSEGPARGCHTASQAPYPAESSPVDVPIHLPVFRSPCRRSRRT